MNPSLPTARFDPLRSDRPLIVYVDLESPYAFIAKDPTRELAESLGIAVDWRPLSLDIPSFAGSARLDAVLARYLDRSFESFWKRELDAESPAEIEAILRESGADVDGFAVHVERVRADYLAEQLAIFEAGIFGVPGYVVEGEYYWGREHLPRIHWILEGRRGPAPDVSYACDSIEAR